MATFNVPPQHLSEGTEENNWKVQSVWPILPPNLKLEDVKWEARVQTIEPQHSVNRSSNTTHYNEIHNNDVQKINFKIVLTIMENILFYNIFQYSFQFLDLKLCMEHQYYYALSETFNDVLLWTRPVLQEHVFDLKTTVRNKQVEEIEHQYAADRKYAHIQGWTFKRSSNFWKNTKHNITNEKQKGKLWRGAVFWNPGSYVSWNGKLQEHADAAQFTPASCSVESNFRSLTLSRDPGRRRRRKCCTSRHFKKKSFPGQEIKFNRRNFASRKIRFDGMYGK